VLGGAIMTPAAPASIDAAVSLRMDANPGAETPTTTGSRVRPRTLATMDADSSASSLGASPICPRIVRPVTPVSS